MRVALILGWQKSGLANVAGIRRGISQYTREKKSWIIHTSSAAPFGTLEYLLHWKPDVVIADLCGPDSNQILKRFPCPVVQVLLNNPAAQYVVAVDYVAVGRMVAQHFVDRGIRHIGFIGNSGMEDHRCEEQGLREITEAMGGVFHSLSTSNLPLYKHPGLFDETDHALASWLSQLPRPAGVMIPDDEWGLWVMQPRVYGDFDIPADIAFVGVSNNELNCEMTEPALSSVSLPLEKVGYEAAVLADRILHGQTSPVRQVFQPLGIEVRGSSDVLAINDPDVREAVRFIRARPHEPLRVKDVLNHILVSRGTLVRKFHTELGRTPLDEIQRVHLERAKELLSQTDLPLSEVAALSGMVRSFQLCRAIKKSTGLTPTSYRRRMSGR